MINLFRENRLIFDYTLSNMGLMGCGGFNVVVGGGADKILLEDGFSLLLEDGFNTLVE